MPDFTFETYWRCQSEEEWELKVEFGGATHTVRWDGHSHLNRTMMRDYSCSCAEYQRARQGGNCPHIKIARGSRCGWDQQRHGLEPHDGKCPLCAAPVSAYRVAV